MHQNNRIISWIISFLFSICMVISISYDQRDNWSLIRKGTVRAYR